MRNLFYVRYFLILTVITPLYATSPYTPKVVDPVSENWRWRHFPELEGKGVRCMAEDEQGIAWFGVNEGVIEYDGYQWRQHGEENGLPGGAVEKLYPGDDGTVYAAGPEGVFEYREDRWHSLLLFKEEPELTYHQIRKLSNGHLFLCTQLGVFEIKKDKNLRVYTSKPKREVLNAILDEAEWVILPDEVLDEGDFMDISDLLEVSPGKLWMSISQDGYGKILQFDYRKINSNGLRDFRVLSRPAGVVLGETQKMLQTHDGHIWIINTSTDVGIHRYNGGQWRYLELSELFGGDEFMTDIMQSSDGTIWIGGLGKLYTFREENWRRYDSPEFKIPANRLMLTPSRRSTIWIGGHKSKVFRLDYSAGSWISYRDLNFQCERHRQEQWFIEVSGRVVRRLGNSWQSFGTSDGLMDAPVRLIATSSGQVWAAGSHKGVAATAYLKNEKWHLQTHPSLSWGIDYRAVFEARDGSLWFGGAVDFHKEKGQFGGVLQLLNPRDDEQAFNWILHKYQENGLVQSNAYGIGQSPDGRIWIGGGNLYFFDGESWDRPDQSYLRQYINIVKSSSDLLLVGSRYYGVFIFDGKEWKQYDTASGLTSNTIISLYADEEGNHWAATENDISRFDGQRWVNHIFPPEMNMTFEGGAILESQNGAIWINKSSREWKRRAFSHSKTPEEVYQNFIAYRYTPDEHPPETIIELYNAEVASDGNTLISWTGEDYMGDTPDNRLVYSYRLDGGAWSPFTSEKHHTFLNLANGNHRLEVRARDLDFNVDATPATVEFEVLPTVWQQGWFIALLLTFLITIAIFEYRIITKKQKLERLNASLNNINTRLQNKNDQVLRQQKQILDQKKELEHSYGNLEERNLKIRSQRDKLEEMVKQVEELSRSKINFFTNISHELRTPLTLILGPLEQLQSRGSSINEEERKHMLEIVERNAYRLLKLINQLLEVRRIESNSLEMTLAREDLGQFIGEIVALFDNLAQEKHIRLSFHNHCSNGLTAFDPDKIEKIIANLLSNAFKNTAEGDSIRVELNDARCDGRHWFKILVEDTGNGICGQKLEHIFERYYSNSKGEAGAGIGLSYIKDLVALHGGDIEVRSCEGKGTVFAISIPDDLEPGRASEQQLPVATSLQTTKMEVGHLKSLCTQKGDLHSSSDGQSKQRILIVEDNEDMIDFLEGVLSDEYFILKASNGREALRLASNHHVDLILSDVMMPEMNGLKFCDNIKSDFETSHIPVILLTAKTMDENIMEGYTTGADDYMTKPFNPELLKIRIRNLLNQRLQLREKFVRDFKLQPKEEQLTSPDEKLLQRVVEIMEEHISDSNFNVNKMCEMVHLSHMHFIRKMKQLTGKKPIELLKSYRMKRAKDLLEQNKVSIAEIAYMVGYDLPNSFSRAFRKEFGFSPTEYMESLEQSKSASMSPEEY